MVVMARGICGIGKRCFVIAHPLLRIYGALYILASSKVFSREMRWGMEIMK